MFEKIKLCIVDVDGTMTDSSIYYDEFGNEMKKFSTRDAIGFFVLNQLGIGTMILTGRECKATSRRAKELKVKYLYQNVKNKSMFVDDFLKQHDIEYHEVAYIGDDLNDLEIMKKCGFKGCPKDACREILSICDVVSDKCGGHGAVRDVIEKGLILQDRWDDVIKSLLG